ncbi:YciI family protein [Pengzhenrongella sicca]|uniref:YCII-related domain-containing protein n=1 Tax=Pengzhenrongella sicca TaxID=2819238 RepID=A0A8A4Z9I6_9MICO|nr:YciI family protein [Pengzhenrongella sicca]QTE28514.1 hypothetical protein J4E96_14205 [Pengzhenrongella sicca]
MAKYLVLIYGDEQAWDGRTPDELSANHAGHRSFASAAGARIVGGEELEASSTATTLRRGSNGGLTVTDGPFLETKEVLGGFYLLTADDLDEAIALAQRLPELSTAHSAVEVRPVVERSMSSS